MKPVTVVIENQKQFGYASAFRYQQKTTPRATPVRIIIKWRNINNTGGMKWNVLKEPRQNQTHSTFQPIKITLAYDVYTDVMKFRYEIQI